MNASLFIKITLLDQISLKIASDVKGFVSEKFYHVTL